MTDIGRHTDALHELGEALRLARAASVGPVETWALAFIGRSHLPRRELAPARKAAVAAPALARHLRWTAFISLPESLLANIDLAEGDADAAGSGYDHAYALSLQLGDPCWEGLRYPEGQNVTKVFPSATLDRRWLIRSFDRFAPSKAKYGRTSGGTGRWGTQTEELESGPTRCGTPR